MLFKIVWDEKAYDSVIKFESIISRRIFKKVDELSGNPFSKDIKRLKGCDNFRLRVGDYRVIFSIEQDTIQILKVGHRKNIYD
ncbi:type II toxin-antitoxin system RelE/ParE family toxin [Candidatus Pacearchaeota archaeon]|nr:type II toxin-antitoxin system RelE/ParE family toxin [Candidatus Pacearchaeota archaeon]